ncbi:unnamed protein product [Acanthoscelides obtectus]|uniref:SURF1-like protein n=1 Tax=Acanthoscelides obtectus TaxID=200917 RepID=A0A9P0L8T2_ACAOB|nr:unnamed protein product [Acanthoscelides obtectus]CAK1661232.1 Surfeit locus protein 1 [Acanthoscelides obtectus]
MSNRLFSKVYAKYKHSTKVFIPRFYSNATAKPLLRPSKTKRISPYAWSLLSIPAVTFGLGMWQVQRKKWKEQLLADLYSRTHSDPVDLPTNLEDIRALEYRPVRVKGEFLHDKELYIGPRSLLTEGDASTKSSLISSKTNTNQGYLVVTPFKLKDRDETILVNRGWVPVQNKNAKTRENGQVKGEVNVIGVVRTEENRPTFSMKNKPDSKLFFYRDLPTMAKLTHSDQIYLDATNDFDIPEGPIGGQTRVSLRNEHLSYILTWFSLSAATGYMWYKRFVV